MTDAKKKEREMGEQSGPCCVDDFQTFDLWCSPGCMSDPPIM